MAVPDSVSLHNLAGHYMLNKSLSDATDPILKMQGMSWFLRQAVSFSTISVHITQHTSSEDNKLRIDVEQISTPGGFKNLETRCLDGEWRDHNDAVFGKVKGWTKFEKVKEVEDEFLREGWDGKSLEGDGDEVVRAYVESVGLKGEQWVADQTWGFEIVEGGRRYVRHVVASRGKEVHRVKMIYDWVKA